MREVLWDADSNRQKSFFLARVVVVVFFFLFVLFCLFVFYLSALSKKKTYKAQIST